MKKFLLLLIIIIALGGLIPLIVKYGEPNFSNVTNLNSEGKNIICFGNSITYGEGVGREDSYPSLLQQKINIPVINAGRNGDTTFDALERLNNDVLNKNPLIVIVEFGGNDYLRRIDKEKTLDNIEKIVAKIINHQAMVIIVGVHCGILGNEYEQGLIKIANRYKVTVIPNVQKGIFTYQYKRDYIHPNEKGYEVIANRIFKIIKGLLIASGKGDLIKHAK